MSQTFVFEELDGATRDYLMTVRAAKGKRMPGLFSAKSTVFPGVCLVCGLILIPLTLVATMTDWLDVVYQDPVRVAFLQTAGLVLGGWLLSAFFRSPSNPNGVRNAGHWVYMDALHLYVAYREQVTVTPMTDVVNAKYSHKYNEGKYQHSEVFIRFGDRTSTKFALSDELRAEQFVVFANYLAWARGEDTEAGKLSSAELGAVARYVARHDAEPKDSEGKLSLDLVEVDLDEVPEEPRREGRAVPSVAPYMVVIVSAAVVFLVMAFAINPSMRDNAIFDAVMHGQPEPRMLRAYLIDRRNKLHRAEVQQALLIPYNRAIQFVKSTEEQLLPEQQKLREGMAKVLESLSQEADQPVVSVRVTERSPASLAGGAASRVKQLREGFVGGDGIRGPNGDGVLDMFARELPPIQPPPGVQFLEKPPPIGHQLIAFVEPPEDAKAAHFQITYEIKPTDGNTCQVVVTIEIRTSIDSEPVASYTKDMGTFRADIVGLAEAMTALRLNLVMWVVGESQRQPPPQ